MDIFDYEINDDQDCDGFAEFEDEDLYGNLVKYACGGGNFELAQVLVLVAGMKIKLGSQSDEKEPLYYAIAGGNLDIVSWLVDDLKLDLKSIGNTEYYNDNALAQACIHGQQHIVEWMYNKHRTFFDACKTAGIYWACRKGHFTLFKWLLSLEPFDVSAKIYDDRYLIASACHSGNLRMVKWLLQQPGVDILVDKGEALLQACRGKHFEMVEWMLKDGGASKGEGKNYAVEYVYRNIERDYNNLRAYKLTATRLENLLWSHGARVVYAKKYQLYHPEICMSFWSYYHPFLTAAIAANLLRQDIEVVRFITEYALPSAWEDYEEMWGE